MPRPAPGQAPEATPEATPELTPEATQERAIVRFGAGSARDDRDQVVVEAPLELRAGGESLLVTMRTPGDDFDLVRGLLFAEGVTDGKQPVSLSRPDGAAADRDNAVTIDLDREAVAQALGRRALAVTSACGVCGAASIAALELRASAVRSSLTVAADVIEGLPDKLRAVQPVFGKTGAIHAAALFDAQGQLLVAREDVGRHNAVDKVIGWALAEHRLPLSSAVLCVSSRIGFEIVEKAVRAGVPVVVGVSAPTTLAIDVAERFRVTLCGFVRAATFNVYSHPSRVT